MIELRGIVKSVRLPSGERLGVLRGVDLQVDRGEVVAIEGRSGSGKTTLLNILGLLDHPDEGRYLLDGAEVAEMDDSALAPLRGATFGFVFQAFNLLDRRSALANVEAPLLHGGRCPRRTRRRRATELLVRVGLAERMMSDPSQLSGGEQQRVSIARSLVRDPAYILADEPTGSLDLGTAEQVLGALVTLVRESRCGLVLVTHDARLASRADRRLVLVGGKLVAARSASHQ